MALTSNGKLYGWGWNKVSKTLFFVHMHGSYGLNYNTYIVTEIPRASYNFFMYYSLGILF